LEISAVSAAVAFLRSEIDAQSWSATGQLPTTLELARSAGVGRVSMTRAVRQLVDEGVLSVRRRRGIRLNTPAPRVEPVLRLHSRVETIKSELVRDVLVGGLGPRRELPSLKELQARYGVSFRTMKRAVDALVTEGMLVRRERGYGLRTAVPGHSVKRLVFVLTRQLEQSISAFSHARSFFYPELYALERECSLRNILLEVERFTGDVAQLAHKPDTLGYCVDLSSTGVERELLSRLVSFGVPVVACLGTDVRGVESLPRHPGLILLECSNELAGYHIGQYLIARGHQRASFLEYSVSTPWSRDRGNGVIRAFRSAGFDSAVSRIALPDLRSMSSEESAVAVDAWLERISPKPGAVWVVCDDKLATAHVMPALQRRGLVPGSDVSLVGFNDQADAFFASLTSYNFNPDGLASAMLFFSQFPERYRRRRKKAHEPVQLTGYIVDRGSVTTNRRAALTASSGRRSAR
jgi:DNA-binding GntR family transcriptional regulator